MSFLLLYLLIPVLLLIRGYISIDNSKYFTMMSKITRHRGFSSEMNTIAPEDCYLSTSFTENNNPKEVTHMDDSLYHSQLLYVLTVDFTSFYYISDGLLYRFLREIEDDMFSLSFSYMKMLSSEVYLKHSSDQIFSYQGLLLYRQASNSNFRLFCGDHLIDSYTVGALFVFTLKIEYETIRDKEKGLENFKTNQSVSKQPIDRFMTEFSEKVQALNLKGKLTAYALQMGGKEYPSQLNENSFKIHSCDFPSLTQCGQDIARKARQLYASFLNQFVRDFDGFYPTTHFVPLTTLSVGTSVQNYGLSLGEPSVTQSVRDNRQKVRELFYQSWNHHRYFTHLEAFYPFRIEEIYSLTTHNFLVLNAIWHEERGLKCFTDIPNCEQETRNIFNYILKSINEDVISFKKRFNQERVYVIQFKDDFCLGNGLEWEGTSQVEIGFFEDNRKKEKAYLFNKNGFIHCQKLFMGERQEISFKCEEKLLSFQMKIIEREYKHYLQCKDDKGATDLLKEYEIDLITRLNDFSY